MLELPELSSLLETDFYGNKREIGSPWATGPKMDFS